MIQMFSTNDGVLSNWPPPQGSKVGMLVSSKPNLRNLGFPELVCPGEINLA